MNLFDCCVPYTALPESALRLNSKVSILTAITLYQTGNISILEEGSASSPSMTRYQARQLSEIRDELVRKEVVIETEDGLQLHPLDMMEDRTLAKTRIVLPSRFDYRTLTLTALKVLLACYSICRYNRTPFQFIANQRDLADRANVTEKSVRDALRQLEDSRLLRARSNGRPEARSPCSNRSLVSNFSIWANTTGSAVIEYLCSTDTSIASRTWTRKTSSKTFAGRCAATTLFVRFGKQSQGAVIPV